MNAVEIDEAITHLASTPYDSAEFPFSFLIAFGNKPTTIARLRTGASNASDVAGGVLQRNNIHIATCAQGETGRTIEALKASPKTAAAKARFVLATDGATFEAEDLKSDDPPVICDYADFANHFGFFLPLAGISTVKQIRESAFDVRATGRLNKLYIELRRHNPAWDVPERQREMNHFMARLIFCFFAEDTSIFNGDGLFTSTIEQMSAPDGSNVHEVIEHIFSAMNTKWDDRKAAGFRPWAETFPYVNGGLFSGAAQAPRFSKLARAFLLNIGSLEWRKINPDIFGSMIQAVTDDEERGALGMHYTSVPNILKVLNPLFLDDLRSRLEEAGDNLRMLLNLRKRMSRIRVFDPACGSGNFLVIAYKEMRAIEAGINKKRGEEFRKTDIPITNFRGIELRDFPAEIARLALIIAEYQCDEQYRGQREALKDFLPLDTDNWITCGNALRLDWLSVCPPTGTGVKMQADDLFGTPLDQAQIDFENEGGETYICGNPPYAGSKKQTQAQKDDLSFVFSSLIKGWKSLDYVAAWFMKAAQFSRSTNASSAFVSADGICQGQQVPLLWPLIALTGNRISFAHTSFWWGNLATNNAVVLVAIIGISPEPKSPRVLFSMDSEGATTVKLVENINGYLVAGPDTWVQAISKPSDDRATMQFGNHPYYGTALIVSREDAYKIVSQYPSSKRFVRPLYGSQELIYSLPRACFWIRDEEASDARAIDPVNDLIMAVAVARAKATRDEAAQKLARTPWRFRDQTVPQQHTLVMPRVSSCNRSYLPCGLIKEGCVVTSEAFALYDAPLWNLSILTSKLHLMWVATVCGKFGPSYRYSNTLGWNTFPVPQLTEQNKADLTACAEDILLAREAHFPATIADLYDPETMPADLRAAHERNDDVLERIYIGRRFRNDTERLEDLFERYTKMISGAPKAAPKKRKGAH